MDDTIALEPPEIPVAAAAGDGIGVGLVALAAGGLTALGAAVALGTGTLDATLHLVPLLVGPTVGAVVLTTPALVVAHQFLGVRSPLTAIAEALAGTAVRVGQVGWGFAPVTLVFAVTAPGSWPLLFLGNAALLALVGLGSATVRLTAADPRHGRWALTVLAWGLLTALVAARLVLYTLPTF